MQRNPVMREKLNFSPGKRDKICLEMVKQIIEARPHENLSLTHLAIESGISKRKLILGFRILYGMSVRQYLIQTRMNHAKKLLSAGDLPAKAIASICGYKNVKYFMTVFKRTTGQTISDYQKSIG